MHNLIYIGFRVTIIACLFLLPFRLLGQINQMSEDYHALNEIINLIEPDGNEIVIVDQIVKTAGSEGKRKFAKIPGAGCEIMDLYAGHSVMMGFPDNIPSEKTQLFCTTHWDQSPSWFADYLLKPQYTFDTFDPSLGPDSSDPYKRFGKIKIKARREDGDYNGTLMKVRLWDSPKNIPDGVLPGGNLEWNREFSDSSSKFNLTTDYTWYDLSTGDDGMNDALLFRSQAGNVDAQMNIDFMLFGDPGIRVFIDSIKVYDLSGEKAIESFLEYLADRETER